MKRFVRRVCKWTLIVALFAALVVGGYKGFKAGDRAVGLGLWPAEPSLTSIDPFERADAAKLAAQKYGGGK
jgi:hypothetical protein